MKVECQLFKQPSPAYRQEATKTPSSHQELLPFLMSLLWHPEAMRPEGRVSEITAMFKASGPSVWEASALWP